MTDPEINILIAEFADPEKYKLRTGRVIRGDPIWFIESKMGPCPITCPKYTESLDAMHVVYLGLGCVARYAFNAYLQNKLGQKEAINASAHDRAEALISLFKVKKTSRRSAKTGKLS